MNTIDLHLLGHTAEGIPYYADDKGKIYQDDGLGIAPLIATGIAKLGGAVLPGIISKLGGKTKQYKSAAKGLEKDIKLLQGDTKTLESNLSQLRTALSEENRATAELRKAATQIKKDIALARDGHQSQIAKSRRTGYIVTTAGTIVFITSLFIPKRKKK